MRRLLLAALATLALLALGASPASAATQWLAPTGSVGANTSCSSPGFVGEAQFGAAVAAASPGDTLHMCAGTWSSVVVGGFDIDKSLTVVGDGQGVTVLDGSGSTLPVLESGAGTLAVRDLTVRNGNAEAPGAIGTVGSLLMEDVTIANSGGFTSSVGMFDPAGTLTIRGSTLTGQAAGASYPAPLVVSSGTTTIEDSTFADNEAGGGGDYEAAGIVVNGSDDTSISVDSSTFSGLSSDCSGVIYNGSGGTSSDLSIVNSTFTGNSAGNYECSDAQLYTGGAVTMRNSTFAGNTGATTEIESYYGMTMSNNIIVGDPTANGTCGYYQGTPVNDGGNVISDATPGCDGFVGGASPSPQAKVTESAIELGPLADNGGPTETMALGARSVARGAAIVANCPKTDQRGVTRGTPCTSGAWQEGASGKPKVKQKGRAGAKSLRVRVRCGGSAPCRIELTGVLEGGGGKLEPKTVKVGGKGKTVTLKYTGELKRSLIAAGGSGKVRVRAREVGGGSATTVVRVSLPDSVTG